MSKDLRQYLEIVKHLGHEYYLEVSRPLSRQYEVTLLQQKLAKAKQYPVVYCKHIAGCDLPLVSGIFASYEMLALALDISPEEFQVDRSVVLREYEKRKTAPRTTNIVDVTQSPVKEIIWRGEDVDLRRLPIMHQAEHNPAPYLTMGITVCKDPDSGLPNLGIYRQQLTGKNSTTCMIVPNHHGARIARRYAELGKKMEFVTFIGHHPTVAMAAVGHRINDTTDDEYTFACGLLGESLELTPATTVDLLVPARAEIAIEGIIDPLEILTDGPFSEADGYYGQPHPGFKIHVTAVTMRHDAIYHELDPIHAEHSLVGLLGREAAINQAIKSVAPGLKAVHIGPEGQPGKFIVYIALHKVSDEDIRKIGLAALNSKFNRIAVLVDEDIDVYDEPEVWWALATRVTDATDVYTVPDTSPVKIIIDATIPRNRSFPKRVTFPEGMWQAMDLNDFTQ
jgi:2,5-furandicarboxylate decarboxylase 1